MKQGATYGAEEFVRQSVTRETPDQRRLREASERLTHSYMLTTPDQVALLTLLVRLTKAQRVLELGTFTGYGTLGLALGTETGGWIVTCDLHGEHLELAQSAWRAAGVAERIEVRLGDAGHSLSQLEREGQPFDLAFIDANQGHAYHDYYEACLRLLRPGGLIVLDNMLWSGAVAAPSRDSTTQALRELNLKLHADPRVDMALLTVGDGLMLARKR